MAPTGRQPLNVPHAESQEELREPLRWGALVAEGDTHLLIFRCNCRTKYTFDVGPKGDLSVDATGLLTDRFGCMNTDCGLRRFLRFEDWPPDTDPDKMLTGFDGQPKDSSVDT
jgi:hypothetical protein